MKPTIAISQMMAAATLFVACSANAQQVVDTPAHADETRVSQGSDKTKPAGATNHFTKKTRSEVLAELQQAQANGTAMPTGFAAFDDATRDAK